MKADFKNQDARDYLVSLPSASVDLTLTDPPYAISKKTGFSHVGENGIDRFAVSMDFGKWDNPTLTDHQSMMIDVTKELYRVSRKGASVIVFYDIWKLQSLKEYLEIVGFKQFRIIEWLKTNPVPLNSKHTYLSNAREVAIVCVKGGNSIFNSEYDNGIYEMPIPRENRFHPTQKPVKLMEQLIEKHTKIGDVVLDPFCGSATTLVAAIRLKRIGIGCEKDTEYYIKARTRLKKEMTVSLSDFE